MILPHTKCPYCVTEIDEHALVCKVCHRDLFLLKSLQEKIAKLEEDVAKIPLLEAELASLRGNVNEEEAVQQVAVVAPQSVGFGWFLGAGILLLAGLLALHWAIVIVYDLNPLYLRLASLFLPLPFGLWLAAKFRSRLIVTALLAGVLSAIAVLGMSAITAWVDLVPVLPQSKLEWREFAEYAASISFSILTGWVIGHVRRRKDGESHVGFGVVLVRIARWVDVGGDAATLKAKVDHLQSLWAAAAAAGTSALSVYTGLKGLLDW